MNTTSTQVITASTIALTVMQDIYLKLSNQYADPARPPIDHYSLHTLSSTIKTLDNAIKSTKPLKAGNNYAINLNEKLL